MMRKNPTSLIALTSQTLFRSGYNTKNVNSSHRLIRSLLCNKQQQQRVMMASSSSLSFFHSQKQQQQQQKEKPYDDPKKQDPSVMAEKAFRNFSELLKSIAIAAPFNFGTSPDTPRDFMVPPFASYHTRFYKLFFDRSFDENEFLEGCKIALQATRQMIVQKDMDALERVVTPEAFKDVKEWFDKIFNRDINQDATAASKESGNEKLSTPPTDGDPFEGKKLILRGHVEEVKKAEIRQIKINFVDESFNKTQTDIIVRFDLREDLAIVDEESGVVAYGTEHVKNRHALFNFTRGSSEEPWKIKAFLE